MFRFKPHYYLVLLLPLFVGLQSNAQDNDKQEMEYRYYSGGNLGLGLGTITNIDVSPILGYRITHFWSAGIGATYQYYLDKRYPFDPVQLNILGGRVFSSVYPIPQIMGHVEYEYLSYKTNLTLFPGMDPSQRISSSNLLVGGGYRQQLSQNTYSYILVLWNLNQTQYTPYTNPVFRVGVEIALF